MSVVIGRAGALLAAFSAVLHGAALGHSATSWIAILTVAMLIGCLYCAGELWTRDTIGSWVLVALMNLAMVGLHLPGAGIHHGAGPGVASAAASAPMQLATTVAIVEVLLATAVLLVRTRVDGELADP